MYRPASSARLEHRRPTARTGAAGTRVRANRHTKHQMRDTTGSPPETEAITAKSAAGGWDERNLVGNAPDRKPGQESRRESRPGDSPGILARGNRSANPASVTASSIPDRSHLCPIERRFEITPSCESGRASAPVTSNHERQNRCTCGNSGLRHRFSLQRQRFPRRRSQAERPARSSLARAHRKTRQQGHDPSREHLGSPTRRPGEHRPAPFFSRGSCSSTLD